MWYSKIGAGHQFGDDKVTHFDPFISMIRETDRLPVYAESWDSRLQNFFHAKKFYPVKMLTSVGILKFTSRINTATESFKARMLFFFSILVFISS